MTRTLRPHQTACIDAVLDDYAGGFRSLVAVMATGAGKTFTAISLARRFCESRGITDPRVAFVAPRVELAKKTIETVEEEWPECTVGLVQGANSQFGRQWEVCVVNSANSAKRLRRLQAQKWHVFVSDECHHSVSGMNRNVINSLINPDTLLLGLTATPNRSDGVALSEVFERISYAYMLPDAIADGALVDLEGLSVHLDIDLDALPRDKEGDFAQGKLQSVMMHPDVVSATVDAWMQHAQGLRTVAFGVQVEHARALCEAFRARGVRADFVHGGMDYAQDREPRYLDLREGRLDVLCNVAVLTEGFDEPSVECVLLARPTTSQGLYTQIVGRGARLYPGKTRCLVLDVTGTCSRISLQSLPMLGGFPAVADCDETEQAARKRSTRQEGRMEHVPSLLKAAREARAVDLLRPPRGQVYQWATTPHGPALSCGMAGIFMVVPDRVHAGRFRVAHIQGLAGMPSPSGAGHAHRIEVIGDNLFSRDAVGLAEAEAKRFAPRRKGVGGNVIGPADPAAVARAIADVRARHELLERQAGEKLSPGAAAAAGPALLRLLRAKRAVAESEALALTRYEVERELGGV